MAEEFEGDRLLWRREYTVGGPGVTGCARLGDTTVEVASFGDGTLECSGSPGKVFIDIRGVLISASLRMASSLATRAPVGRTLRSICFCWEVAVPDLSSGILCGEGRLSKYARFLRFFRKHKNASASISKANPETQPMTIPVIAPSERLRLCDGLAGKRGGKDTVGSVVPVHLSSVLEAAQHESVALGELWEQYVQSPRRLSPKPHSSGSFLAAEIQPAPKDRPGNEH